MTIPSMIERVAMAMDEAAKAWAAQWSSSAIGFGPDTKTPTPADCPYSVTARAAIEAMRVPTSEIVEAMLECGPIGCCNLTDDTAREVWDSAITTALGTTP